MPVKILLLTFYYPPDLSAGSFRTEALVKALRDETGGVAEIDIVTAVPNRYRSFSVPVAEEPAEPGVRIIRIPIPAHTSGLVDQGWAYAVFAQRAYRLLSGERYDVVVATTSRLMTGVLGALVARRSNAPFYLDIRDIFCETLVETVPLARSIRRVSRAFSRLEHWTVSNAASVNLVSEGFLEYFNGRYPGRHFSVFTNGVDEEFATSVSHFNSEKSDRLKVVYAGNIGKGQGLDLILPEIARRLSDQVDFLVVGDGGRRTALETALREAGVTNVTLLDPVPRRHLKEIYRQADALFLHLSSCDAFRRVLPSKLFEYGATGKPLWLGVSGYAKEFARKELDNIAVFSPGDGVGAVAAFRDLELVTRPRAAFVTRFSRSTIMRGMATEILRVAHSGSGGR